MNQYDYILEVEPVEKFNPYHDERGRFASRGRYSFFTIRTKDPGKQHWADMAVAREKDKEADRNARLRAQRKVEFTPAKSKKEAVSYAKDNLGFKNVSYGTKMDLDTINHINKTITEIQTKYPEVKGAVQDLKTLSKNGTYAQVGLYYGGKMELKVSSKYYGQGLDYMKKNYDNSTEIGFHPKGTEHDAIIWHEYGHVLHNISNKQKAGLSPSDNVHEMRIDQKEKLSLTQKLYDIAHSQTAQKEWANEAASELGIPSSKLADGISKYAQKNFSELFAEAFAEVMRSKNPSKEALAIVKASGWYRE